MQGQRPYRQMLSSTLSVRLSTSMCGLLRLRPLSEGEDVDIVAGVSQTGGCGTQCIPGALLGLGPCTYRMKRSSAVTPSFRAMSLQQSRL